eukprot:CAMPEP_0119218982 /NCGR_PEP_ID=MMETSP1327-20130426/22261_1 /TAXON_ID=38833 /ORGANISM="Micromonas pusilla, Strain RCC2306" /LENGTH=53 /DNA_ID=CAMNT_0007217027 /DNA_START=183 /DNA_END=340 /DNA_ORIENTATION=+
MTCSSCAGYASPSTAPRASKPTRGTHARNTSAGLVFFGDSPDPPDIAARIRCR